MGRRGQNIARLGRRSASLHRGSSRRFPGRGEEKPPLRERLQTWIAVIALLLSLAALGTSILAAFRDTFFPFSMKMLMTAVLFPATSKSLDITGLPVMLTVTFLNTGYSDGVIEDVRLIVVDTDGEEKYYVPQFTIDLEGLFQAVNPILSNKHVTGYLEPFLVKAKSATTKTIVFWQPGTLEGHPFSAWKPGDYCFLVYAKVLDRQRPFEAELCLPKINEGHLTGYKRGKTHFLYDMREGWTAGRAD